VQNRVVVTENDIIACRIPMTLNDLQVIHLLQTFRRDFWHSCQDFNWCSASRGS